MTSTRYQYQVPGTWWYLVAYSQLSATLHKPGTWATGTYKVPALVVPVVPDTWQQYTLLDIRSESIIYVGLQWYKIERTFYTFLWWKSSTFFRKAGAEKMNHGGSKQKPLLTELAVRKNMDEIPHRFTYRNYICSTFFCTSSPHLLFYTRLVK